MIMRVKPATRILSRMCVRDGDRVHYDEHMLCLMLLCCCCCFVFGISLVSITLWLFCTYVKWTSISHHVQTIAHNWFSRRRRLRLWLLRYSAHSIYERIKQIIYMKWLLWMHRTNTWFRANPIIMFENDLPLWIISLHLLLQFFCTFCACWYFSVVCFRTQFARLLFFWPCIVTQTPTKLFSPLFSYYYYLMPGSLRTHSRKKRTTRKKKKRKNKHVCFCAVVGWLVTCVRCEMRKGRKIYIIYSCWGYRFDFNLIWFKYICRLARDWLIFTVLL